MLGFRVVATVGGEFCCCKDILIPADGLEVFSGSIYHGFQEIMFLGLAERFSMDDGPGVCRPPWSRRRSPESLHARSSSWPIRGR